MILMCRARGCRREVVQGSEFCPTCFAKLPEELRQEILTARRKSRAAETVAVSKANQWLLLHK